MFLVREGKDENREQRKGYDVFHTIYISSHCCPSLKKMHQGGKIKPSDDDDAWIFLDKVNRWWFATAFHLYEVNVYGTHNSKLVHNHLCSYGEVEPMTFHI